MEAGPRTGAKPPNGDRVLFALAFVMIGGRVVELTLVSKNVSERPPRLANTIQH